MAAAMSASSPASMPTAIRSSFPATTTTRWPSRFIRAGASPPMWCRATDRALLIFRRNISPRFRRGEMLRRKIKSARSVARHHIGGDAPARINRLGHRVVVVAGNDDRIAVGIDAGDDADMAAAMTPHHRDGADLRPRDARAVVFVTNGEIAAAGVSGALEDQVHERATPKAAAPGRVGADIFARLGDQRVVAKAAKGRVRVRLRPLIGGHLA